MVRRKHRSAPGCSSSVLFAEVPATAPEPRRPRLGCGAAVSAGNLGSRKATPAAPGDRALEKGRHPRGTSLPAEAGKRNQTWVPVLPTENQMRMLVKAHWRQSVLRIMSFSGQKHLAPAGCGDSSETSRNICPGGPRAGPPPAGEQPPQVVKNTRAREQCSGDSGRDARDEFGPERDGRF